MSNFSHLRSERSCELNNGFMRANTWQEFAIELQRAAGEYLRIVLINAKVRFGPVGTLEISMITNLNTLLFLLLLAVQSLQCSSSECALQSPHVQENDEGANAINDGELWLTFEAGSESKKPNGKKHVVLVAAEQEYRSEQAMPMLAQVLAEHHGFDCTVLFLMNENGLIDPTIPAPLKKDAAAKFHRVPGLKKLDDADCVILLSRFLQLPDDQLKYFHDYFDSGKPIIALRTANHGIWRDMKYTKAGKKVSLRDLFGGKFMGHHGGWHREATSGIIVPENKDHPILRGVKGIWGPSDVYRCHNDKHPFPADATALVLGQPMVNLNPDAEANTNKEPLPIAWTKTWVGNKGLKSRILHFTMGSARDFENEGVRRLVVNGVYWGLGLESQIRADANVEIVGQYAPRKSGFNYEKLGVLPHKPSVYLPK